MAKGGERLPRSQDQVARTCFGRSSSHRTYSRYCCSFAPSNRGVNFTILLLTFAPHFFEIFLLFIIACTFPPSPFRRRSLLAGRTPPPLFHILGGGGGGGGLLDSPPEREDSLSLSLSFFFVSLSRLLFPLSLPRSARQVPLVASGHEDKREGPEGFFRLVFSPLLSLSLKGRPRRALHKREKFRPPSIPSFRQQYCIGQ